jgi:3'(2'), 5'-bisphosphate nucleotidase
VDNSHRNPEARDCAYYGAEPETLFYERIETMIQETDFLLHLAEQAGKAILLVYESDFSVQQKADHSPLTLADMRSHAIISEGLRRRFPDIPILSEEGRAISYEERSQWERFWLVDPLDGTKEFVKRNGEFTVNIALVEDSIPVLSVVHAPVLGTTYLGQRGVGAWLIKEGAVQPISVAPPHEGELRVVASRSHSDEKTTALLQKLPPRCVVSSGSSLKFCMVAEGSADFYPRLGPTMEWDTAAAQCVLESAGGRVVQCDGQPLRYNKSGWRNPFFYAIGAWLPVYDELVSARLDA